VEAVALLAHLLIELEAQVDQVEEDVKLLHLKDLRLEMRVVLEFVVKVIRVVLVELLETELLVQVVVQVVLDKMELFLLLQRVEFKEELV
jgi:hypothetical protein